MQVSWTGGLAALAKKGLDEHTLTFDSHEPRRSAFRPKKSHVDHCFKKNSDLRGFFFGKNNDLRGL